MSETVLTAETGRQTGSANARRLRATDHIPAVLYGMGMEPVSLSVARRELRAALSGAAGVNTVLDLTVDGKVYPSIIKDLQRHPVRNTVSHVDFIQLDLAKEITVTVPVRIEGEAVAVTRENGMVSPIVDSLDVVTTPRDIPDEIVIDVTEMTMDTVITLADIQLPSGVTAVAEPDTTLVTTAWLRTEAEEEAEEGEAAEGEAAEAGEAESAEGGAEGEGESSGE